jgi:hypothetical protein
VYAGNYDTYVKTRSELEEAQMKKYKWEQEQIADMKEYIARFGHGSAKLARQAQSKEKTLEKMVRGFLCRVSQGVCLYASWFDTICGIWHRKNGYTLSERSGRKVGHLVEISIWIPPQWLERCGGFG